MPPCTPERDRQLLSLMWNRVNLNIFGVGPPWEMPCWRRKIQEGASLPPHSGWLIAEPTERWREKCALFHSRVAKLLEAKATSSSEGDNFCQVILSCLYQNIICISWSFFPWDFFFIISLCFKALHTPKNNVQMYVCSTEWIYMCVYIYDLS